MEYASGNWIGKGIVAVAIALTGRLGWETSAIAQAYLPCDPPAANEYLLLVEGDPESVRETLDATFPDASDITVCNYLDRVLTRVGGFADAETANSWAQYFADLGNLQAFVARPASAADVSAPQQEDGEPQTVSALPQASDRYSPQQLGAGYAILVRFFDQPQVAADLQQALDTEIGLAAYNQEPYLLAIYTADQAIAASTLADLTERDFSALMVDSEDVVLLSPGVVIIAE